MSKSDSSKHYVLVTEEQYSQLLKDPEVSIVEGSRQNFVQCRITIPDNIPGGKDEFLKRFRQSIDK